MKYTLKHSNDYLIKHAGQINMQYRPRFHFAPPVGWMNDPNGICYFRNSMHIFYQYYPFDSCWGSMHWGHAVTKDNCVFRHCSIALAPDLDDESGCFSGGAVVNKDNGSELLLMYTKHYEKDGIRQEIQGMASSSDGIHFSKREGPVIGISDLPPGVSGQDFRDPNPVLIGDEYFIFIGSKTDENEGIILVYSSDDGKKFSYRNCLRSPYFGEMGECPDFFRLGGKDVLLVSAINVREEPYRFHGSDSSVYFIGRFDPKNGTFETEHLDEIDCGGRFYAPQTCLDGQGRRIMVAWMESWDGEYFLHKQRHGYNGALTYPRILSVKDGLLYQWPAPGVEKYRRATDFSAPVSKCADATFSLKEGGTVFVRNERDGGDGFAFGMSGGRIWLDTSFLKNSPSGKRFSKYVYRCCTEVRALLDTSSVELFVDGGKETFTERFYIDSNRVAITCENASLLEGYELALPDENFTIIGGTEWESSM